ncbi:unannotated protein [freshwater metagenome]|uniref:Unannotated protein n=1 Tax=freshwater metagenome TaxID=449393 RepID=A0A6J7KUK7_9ZZZZ
MTPVAGLMEIFPFALGSKVKVWVPVPPVTERLPETNA